ncbi:MAG TPA: DUF3786 domain-containing protein [Anaerovoracaceae bacterium]|nr:DUF3786 domain-containing protein [Anaerovoracaceae bacterium]
MERESNLTNAYLEAYRRACGRLLDCDPETVCQNSKAVYENGTKTYRIPYFGRQYRISCADGEVSFQGDSDEPEKDPTELPTTEKVLILHYLIHAQPKPLTGRTISFKEVPNGGSIYYPTFKKRAIDPLVKTFSEDFPGFAEAAAALGGSAEKLGDAGMTIHAFPFVPLTYVVWKGDDEIASSGTILFDSSVFHFLPVEDIIVAASFGVYKLIDVHKNKNKE